MNETAKYRFSKQLNLLLGENLKVKQSLYVGHDQLEKSFFLQRTTHKVLYWNAPLESPNLYIRYVNLTQYVVINVV